MHPDELAKLPGINIPAIPARQLHKPRPPAWKPPEPPDKDDKPERED